MTPEIYEFFEKLDKRVIELINIVGPCVRMSYLLSEEEFLMLRESTDEFISKNLNEKIHQGRAATIENCITVGRYRDIELMACESMTKKHNLSKEYTCQS